MTATGSLAACAVQEENPEDAGFGGAALQLSTTYAISPWTTDGLPAEDAHLHLPITMTAPH